MRTLLITATAATGVGFLILANLPTGGHHSPLLGAVVLVGFGTVGTVFGTTVMAASGMADADRGLVAVCFGPRHVGSTGIAASITTIDVPAHSDTSEKSIQMRGTA
jgi:hypothetical protein